MNEVELKKLVLIVHLRFAEASVKRSRRSRSRFHSPLPTKKKKCQLTTDNVVNVTGTRPETSFDTLLGPGSRTLFSLRVMVLTTLCALFFAILTSPGGRRSSSLDRSSTTPTYDPGESMDPRYATLIFFFCRTNDVHPSADQIKYFNL